MVMAKMCPKCLRAVLTCNCQVETNKPRVAPGPTRPQRADRLAAERARFEEWCRRCGYGHSPGLTDADKAWIDMRLAVRWEAWLAALGIDP